MAFDPTVQNFLGAIVISFGLGLGWSVATWAVAKIAAKLG